jgi:DNA-binding MarR family transcriptional regulator
VRLSLTDHGVEVVARAVQVVRALDAELTAPLGGPGSDQIRALGAALQALLHASPEPDAIPETGGEP